MCLFCTEITFQPKQKQGLVFSYEAFSFELEKDFWRIAVTIS